MEALLRAVMPELQFARPIRGRVVRSHTAAGVAVAGRSPYSVDVQPLNREGIDEGPVLQQVEVSMVVCGANVGVWAMPAPGAIVRVAWHYWDAGQPYVDAFLSDGSVPAHPVGAILLRSGATEIRIDASGAMVDGPVVQMGGADAVPLVRLDRLMAKFNTHTHPSNGTVSPVVLVADDGTTKTRAL
jgi:hypothetical protein